MPARPPKGRSVKSEPGQGTVGAADGHEWAKDFLSATELAALLESAKAGRHGTRDRLLLMMMFRHGLRVSEAVGLRLDELDLGRSMLWVHRLKSGLSVCAAAHRWRRTARDWTKLVPRSRRHSGQRPTHWIASSCWTNPAVRITRSRQRSRNCLLSRPGRTEQSTSEDNKGYARRRPGSPSSRPPARAATSGWRTPAAASVSPPSSALIATAQGTGSTREKDYCRV
jgi:hypothetical protein